jgi:hypothetical protein
MNMQNIVVPTELYVGLRDAVIAEVGTPDFYEGKYLIQPAGDAEFLPESADTLKEAKVVVAWLKREFPGICVCWL